MTDEVVLAPAPPAPLAVEPMRFEDLISDVAIALGPAEAARRIRLMFESLRPSSQRALRQDLITVMRWCRERGQRVLPMDPTTLEAFLRHQVQFGKTISERDKHGIVRERRAGKSRATISRYVVSIKRLHTRLEVESPTAHATWPDVWRAISQSPHLSPIQASARGLEWATLETALEAQVDAASTLDRRDIAIVCLLYDGLLREDELCNMRREDLARTPDGGASILLRRTKTRKSRYARVNPDSLRRLDAWFERAPGHVGPIFVALAKRVTRLPKRYREQMIVPVDADTPPLRPADVDEIVRRMLVKGGIDPTGFSGHSGRVGQCRDLFVNDVALPAIMEECGWSSPAMPARYAAGLDRQLGASARLAKKLGRG